MCEGLFDLLAFDDHLENGKKVELSEWIHVSACRFCQTYFQENELTEGFCNSCDADAGSRRKAGPFPLAQRLERNINSVFISNPGLETIEDYLEKWLSAFSSKDRGMLTWIFLSKVRPNLMGTFEHDHFWYTPIESELIFDRQVAYLPKSPADINQLSVLHDWYKDFRPVLSTQFANFGENPDDDNSGHSERFISTVESLWAFDTGELRSMDEVAALIGLELFWVELALTLSKDQVSSSANQELRALNEKRDRALWAAKFLDRLKIDLLPFDGLHQVIESGLEFGTKKENEILLSYVVGEMSETEIVESLKVNSHEVKEVLSAFSEIIYPKF